MKLAGLLGEVWIRRGMRVAAEDFREDGDG